MSETQDEAMRQTPPAPKDGCDRLPDLELAEAAYESGFMTIRSPLIPNAKRTKQIPVASP